MSEDEIKSLLPECLLRSGIYYLIITDLEGRYIFVNEVFKRRFAFISDNFIGQSSFNAIYHEDHQACLQAVEQCFANPDKAVKVHLRKPDTNQQDFYWTEWEFSVFKDRDKKPIGILCLGHDISETEKATRKAKKFAQKVETIIEEIREGFYQLDRDWNFVVVNKAAERILGVPREQLLGRNIWDLFPDTPNYNYPAQFRKAMAESIAVTFEDYRPDLDRWFSAVGYPSSEGLTVFFRDITQQKRSKIALQDSENKLRAILDSTSESNLFVSPDKKVLSFNKSAYEIILRFIRKPVKIGADIEDFLLKENKHIFNTYFPKALAGESHIVEVERQLNNQKVWLEVTYKPVYQSNSIIGVSINSKDITDRKQAELKLKEQEYMLRAIYESTSEASTFIDKDFIIRYNNQVARNVTKQVFGREAQIGDYSLDYFLPEYRAEFEEYYKRALQGETIIVERTDGTNWWQLSMFPVYDKKQNIIGLANNVQDITDRKNREIKILQQNETLQRIAWQQSHEVRRPVANILGLCELLKNYKNEPEETKNQYVDYMLQAAQELDEIVRSIVQKSYNL